MMPAPPQETRQVLIPEHMHRSSQMQELFRTMKGIRGGNKKDTKTKNSKKKNQKPKHSAFANMKDDDPMSFKLAISLEIQEKGVLMNI
jgi:hypothetical protein